MTRLAQLEERSTFNRVVEGSIPSSGVSFALVDVVFTSIERCNDNDEVTNTIEEALIHSSSSGSITPLVSIVMALTMAAIDENVHLDGVYFLIRREPDILQKLLSSSSLSSIESATNSNQRKRKRNDIIYQNIMDEE